ncbi:hypothetical protein SVAN01_00986 [Stagonosporopsis vannaccii]|nr:hypothetical protein SVAN01_00986 [Stagonosporopsis vannaccii]
MFLHYDPYLQVNGRSVTIAEQTYVVDGKTYRVSVAFTLGSASYLLIVKATRATATIGANAQDGVIYFFNVKSAVEGAKLVWGVTQPPVDQLPQLKQISDMAWGIWRRRHPDGQNLGSINKFLVYYIVNPITNELVAEALRTYNLEPGQTRLIRVPQWPGVTFSMDSEQGVAMLGSPNGIAVGYFLAQHKTQLGGNKYVTDVQIFLNEDNDDEPYMIFHVADVQTDSSHGERPKGFEGIGITLARSPDSKSMIRKHIARARL